MPVEMVLRPQYGSRYFSPVNQFFTAVMMIVVPVFYEMAAGFSRMLPFVRFNAPDGAFRDRHLLKAVFSWGVSSTACASGAG